MVYLAIPGALILGLLLFYVFCRIIAGSNDSLSNPQASGQAQYDQERAENIRKQRESYDKQEYYRQKNYDEMCQLAAQLEAMQKPALNYGPSYPQLPDGDVIDAEVTDLGGLLK